MPDLKIMARQALTNCNAFADAAMTTGNGQSEGYRRIAQAYHRLAAMIISEMNVEAAEAACEGLERGGDGLRRNR